MITRAERTGRVRRRWQGFRHARGGGSCFVNMRPGLVCKGCASEGQPPKSEDCVTGEIYVLDEKE